LIEHIGFGYIISRLNYYTSTNMFFYYYLVVLSYVALGTRIQRVKIDLIKITCYYQSIKLDSNLLNM